MGDLDALVVGSGPNGLSAAITLAEAGRSVLVLEAQSCPGGAVRTEELTLPGFHHDVFSAVHPGGAASPAFAAMGLERHGLRWVQPRYGLAHPLPDGRAAVLARDVAETAASLDGLHPGDGARWRDFATPFLEHYGALRRTVLGGFPPLRGATELLARLGPRSTLRFARLALTSSTALAGRLFAGGDARAWLHGSALHADVPLDVRGSAVGAVHLSLLGHAVGWPSPEGGAGRLTDALVARLAELGGEVRCGARVARVLVRGGRAAGVELAGGERLVAPLVVADVAPRGLLALADGALPRRYAAALGRYRHGPATVKVDWALSGPIPWAAPAARAAGTVHVGGGEPDLLAADVAARTGWPERPFLILGQQSIADPTRAPAGSHTAWAYTHGRGDAPGPTRAAVAAGTPSAHGRGDPPGPTRAAVAADTPSAHSRGDPRWADIAERIEAQVERFAPGFRALILARHVLGPGELEARDANLVGGDVGGGSYVGGQVVFRPVRAISPYRTPIRGLYLGSAATYPGGGVHGVSGRAAARLALADARC